MSESHILRARAPRRIHSIAFAAAMACAGPAAGQAVSPYLYGTNLWDGNQAGQGADRVWGHMRTAGLKLIRIGGIQYNDEPAPHATYARWIDSIRAAGAEPLVQVSSLESPAQAAALIEELNGKRGYKIRFWSIGNEPTCGKGADAGTVAGIAANFKARASAMKAADTSIRIFVGDECYWRTELYNPLVGGDQDLAGKDAAGRWYADVIAFHTYPFPGADQNAKYTREQVLQQGVAGVRSMLSACRDQVEKANAKHGRAGASALTCALTEFNVTYWNSSDNSLSGVGASSFLNGHFFAQVYGMAMQYGTFAVLPWSMMQSDGDGSGDDLGMFSQAGAAVVPRPAFHHLSMMSRNMRGTYLPATSAAAAVKAFATRKGDTLAILVLNQGQGQGGRLAIRLADAAPAATVAYPVRVPVPREGGEPAWDGEVLDTLPPESTLLLKVLRGGKVAYRLDYSLALALQGQGPKEERFTVGLTGYGTREGRFPAAIFRAGFLEGTLSGSGAYRVELRNPDGALAALAEGTGDAAWRLDTRALRPAAYLLSVSQAGRRETRMIALLGR